MVGMGIYYYTQRDSRNDILHRAPDESLTSVALMHEFAVDDQKAEERFLGKTIEVEGDVLSIEKTSGKTTISLNAGDPISAIVCEMNNNLQSDFSMIHENQTLKIKGEVSGKLMDIILVNCTVVN